MTTNHLKHEITDDVIRSAKENPNGWVYKIEGSFGSNDQIPPENIVGAWKVNGNGNLTGEFLPNPKYRPKGKQGTVGSANTCE